MPNKKLMLGVSVGVAALVLLLTVLVGGPGSGDRDDTPDAPANPNWYLPDESNADEQFPLGEAEGLVYEIKESGILFFANRIVPRTEGEIDVIDTSIRIHFAPGRELTIDADEGTIVAPDQHPQEGQMRGNVIVTLFETPDGSDVDFDSDQHVVIRMYFDEPVDFDLELQQIDSAGPLFMTGPQVQYRGRGLSMNYNQRYERIERLVIEEGESLHYIPEPVAPVSMKSSGKPELADNSHPDRDASTPAQAGVPDQAPAAEEKPDRPVQYYLATFEQLEDVRVGQDQYVVTGDDLSAVFSTKVADELDESGSPGSPSTPGSPGNSGASRTTEPDRSRMLASSDPMSAALMYALSASIGQVPGKDARSLATFTDEDVVITWSGRLVVTPLSDEDVPEALAGPGDVMVTIKGTPANIITDQGETVRAPKISFFSLNSGMLAEGTAVSPVIVDAPGLGSLTGAELAIDQTLGTGYVLGPGTLNGLVRKSKDDKPASNITSAETSSLASETPVQDTQPIAVSFDERLNLAFHLKQKDAPKDESDEPASSGRVKGVKTADFLGNVRVDYAELDMTTDRLTLALLEDPPEGDDKLAVESLTAIGNVEAFVKAENVSIYANSLIADPAKNQLELFGSPETQGSPSVPARVVRPDATLVGQHMVMDDQGGTVTIPGPGSFDFIPDLAEPGKTVHVTWATSMNYDDTAGTAQFIGDVKTLSIDGTDTNELMGEKLDLTFVLDEVANKDDPTSGRRLATATMDGHVRYRARSYATTQLKQIQTELYLTDSKKMVFTDPGTSTQGGSTEAVQQVQILGHGRMLITDNRPEDEAAVAKPGDEQQPIDFGGRGLTAFEWSDKLVLDLTHGEMLMKGAVAMVHQPAPGSSGDRVQLDCTDLAAELKTAKGKKKKAGSDGWLSEDAPKPELNRVWADGGIRIISGDITVTCDHLLYEETKREIILWSDDPNVVIYEAKGQPVPAKSSAFKWHRDTGRVEAFRLRSGTIPLRRTEREDE